MSIQMTDRDLSMLARMIDNAPNVPVGERYGAAIRTPHGIVTATLHSDNSVIITQEVKA